MKRSPENLKEARLEYMKTLNTDFLQKHPEEAQRLKDLPEELRRKVKNPKKYEEFLRALQMAFDEEGKEGLTI